MLRDLGTIRHRLYRLPRDPLADEVLNPAFGVARSVAGAFGWFSSAWLASLSHGLARFLSSPHIKDFKIVIAPALFPQDFEFLTSVAKRQQCAIDRIDGVIRQGVAPDADALERHAVECLGWMLLHGIVDIRVAIPKPGCNYHPKMWLFDDGRDKVLVRGSANATARALGAGVEHMDVDCSWIDESRVTQSISIINDWLSGEDDAIATVIPLPEALRNELIRHAPAETPSVDRYEVACALSRHLEVVRRSSTSFVIPQYREWQSGKFSHQSEAVHAWESADGNGLLEMATGAGKTVTALICAQRLHFRLRRPLLVVISAPTLPLVGQWRDACSEFGLHVAASESANAAQQGLQFSNAIERLRLTPAPGAAAFVVTNRRLANPAFQNLIRERALNQGIEVLHIGDEAHSLGAEGFQRSPRNFANFRLGLSATPMRQYDEIGTERLMEYFGQVVFRFGLDRAIGVCLVPYDYNVSTAEIQGEELHEFLRLSALIARKVAALGDDRGALENDTLTTLLVQRRAVVETAADKLRVFRRVVEELKDRSLCLVYTSSKNPRQLTDAIEILASLGVAAATVTETESANRPQFEAIIESFQAGALDMLVAKRVLDEGVDIPAVRQALILASSSVEREWIQRRGRILRVSPGKAWASIHDIISLPPPVTVRYDDSVLKFISSEIDRVRAFARFARNYESVAPVIERIHELYFLR